MSHCQFIKMSNMPHWSGFCYKLYFLLAVNLDERDGLAMSLKESGALVEEGKEREAQLQARIRSLEKQTQALAEREQEVWWCTTQDEAVRACYSKSLHVFVLLVRERFLCVCVECKAATCSRGSDGQHAAADDGAVSVWNADASTWAAWPRRGGPQGTAWSQTAGTSAETRRPITEHWGAGQCLCVFMIGGY